MFRDAHTRDVQLANRRMDIFADQWQRTAATWFDGSVESVDRRLAALDRALAYTSDSVARLGSHIRCAAKIPDFRAAREELVDLRERMLTGAAPLSQPITAATVGPRSFDDFPDELMHLE